ncbi:MAG: histidinol-phosphate transaminase [Myxococcota bacterium]
MSSLPDQSLVGPGVASLRPHVASSDGSALRLFSNENPLGPSPLAIEAVRASVERAHQYPDPQAEALKERLAQRHDVSTEEIVVGHGSTELIDRLVRTFVQPGQTVVAAWPSFVMFSRSAHAANREILQAPLRSFRTDLAALAGLVDIRTKLVFICNPNNPTGSYVTRRELNAFLDRIPPHVIVAVDEAYYEFATARDFPDAVSAVRSRPRTAVLRTFSKVFGLAGLRVGYGVMDPELVGPIESARPPYDAARTSLSAAHAALDDVEHIERSQRMVFSERRRMSEALRGLGLEPLPSQANFICVRCPDLAEPRIAHLSAAGIEVASLQGYDMPEAFRLAIGTPSMNARVLDALNSFA